ncbi:AI-2E family transporter [Allopusillimonas ginsengisoli]|uniref:AI-2E family transporter n=1 Tax=Allopusillimonas ginsengisoli TaxID=453575 RepID=UPI0039C1667D
MAEMSFTRKTLIMAAAIALGILFWLLADVFALAFGMVVVAATLDAIMRPVVRRTGWPRRIVLALVLFALVAILSLFFWFAGASIAEQLQTLRQTLPDAAKAALDWLRNSSLGPVVSSAQEGLQEKGVPWGGLASAASLTVGALSAVTLAIIMGIYLAADPDLYRRGLLRLFPVDYRPRLRRGLDAASQGLHRWLLGQFCSMAAVGLMTAIGLWALDMPLAAVLGLIAALLAFVPFFGPIVAGILAVMLAFTEGPMDALYVALLFLGIQQVEGDVLMPMLQRWAIRLPPILGLMSVVVFSILFGLPGVVLATPMIIVVMVLVQKLYVEDVLEDGRL